MKTRPNKDIEIFEPINYERLAASYRTVKWRWSEVGFPSAEALRALVEQLRKESRPHISTGGVTIADGRTLIHRKLFTFYVLPPQIAECPQMAEEGDWTANLRAALTSPPVAAMFPR